MHSNSHFGKIVEGWARCALQKTFRLSLSLERTVAHHCPSVAGLVGYGAQKRRVGARFPVCAPSPPYVRSVGNEKIASPVKASFDAPIQCQSKL